MLQVWFRVNEQLPMALQKSLPDSPPEMQSTEIREGDEIFHTFMKALFDIIYTSLSTTKFIWLLESVNFVYIKLLNII